MAQSPLRCCFMVNGGRNQPKSRCTMIADGGLVVSWWKLLCSAYENPATWIDANILHELQMHVRESRLPELFDALDNVAVCLLCRERLRKAGIRLQPALDPKSKYFVYFILTIWCSKTIVTRRFQVCMSISAIFCPHRCFS